MTWGPGIAVNEAALSLILKRTGEVLLRIFPVLNCPSVILIFYQYNISMAFQRGNLPDWSVFGEAWFNSRISVVFTWQRGHRVARLAEGRFLHSHHREDASKRLVER
jgi:hypothetical protein